jgi:hypothetical protein
MRAGNDRLYLTNGAWSILRDAGILVESNIKIRIDEVYSKGNLIKIFPIRDVIE